MSRLTVTRRDGEQLLIGDDIVITVSNRKRGQTRVVVEAPPEVTILRAELAQRGEVDSHAS